MPRRLQLRYLPISSIKFPAFYPAGRLKKRFTELVASIEKNGLLEPVLITRDRRLCEGRMRIAAHLALGLDEIATITTDMEPHEAFYEANTCRRGISKNDLLSMYFESKSNVPTEVRDQLDRLGQEVGVSVLRSLARNGHSWQPIVRAREILVACRNRRSSIRIDRANMVRVVNWLVERRMMQKSHDALKYGYPPLTMWQHILHNRPFTPNCSRGQS